MSVSSLGDATSLAGGTLIATPLLGADGEIYAVAQGPVAVSGFSQNLVQAESLTQGIPTVGRIPNGGLIEKDIFPQISQIPDLVLELSNPDFKTAIRITDAINRTAGTLRGTGCPERDYRTLT
jgi:flagellar P-ring protein precursor FlgI